MTIPIEKILEGVAACIVQGNGKKKFQKLYDKLGTDKMIHVHVLLCIFQGSRSREECRQKRKSDIRDQVFVDLEIQGYISHQRHGKKQKREYSLTDEGKERAESWITVMSKVMKLS
jgi:hypothetical protein